MSKIKTYKMERVEESIDNISEYIHLMDTCYRSNIDMEMKVKTLHESIQHLLEWANLLNKNLCKDLGVSEMKTYDLRDIKMTVNVDADAISEKVLSKIVHGINIASKNIY